MNLAWKRARVGGVLGLYFLGLAAPGYANLEPAPSWAEGAVWYQIFPERFRNGDPTNDLQAAYHPDREKLQKFKSEWTPSPWTSDWYRWSDYERSLGWDFYGCVGIRRYGGDLQGIVDRLDYLKALGITALYLNPVFEADSSHKYDWTRLHHVDPWFGPDPLGDLALMAEETLDPSTWTWTAADKLLLHLISECHRREIRVVLDGVFNHSGRNFPAFQDLRTKGPASPYVDWFSGVNFNKRSGYPGDDFDYHGWWGFKSLPEFAEKAGRYHPELESYIVAATRRWMDPNEDKDPADGVDGWRLDVADEVSPVFWRFWHERVREINPQAQTFAETWKETSWLIREGSFDAAMNYHGFAMPVKEFVVDDGLSSEDFLESLHERLEKIPAASRLKMMNFLDTHDTDRIASMIANRKRKTNRGFNASNRVAKKEDQYLPANLREEDTPLLELAAFLQMTWPGSPMIYYGTEAGMWGGGDPDNRMPMIWEDLKYEDQASDPLRRPRKPDPVAFSKKRFEFYQKLISFRQSHSVLLRGDVEMVEGQSADDLLAFCRSLDGTHFFILVNRGPRERTLRLPGAWNDLPARHWEPLYITTGNLGEIRLTQVGQRNGIQIPGESGAVLRVQRP